MDTPVYSFDTSTSNEVFFPPLGSNGTVVTIRMNFQFVSGQEYYILMDSGKYIDQDVKLSRNSNEDFYLIYQSIDFIFSIIILNRFV